MEQIQQLLKLRERIIALRKISTFVKTLKNISLFERRNTTQYITWCNEVVKNNTDPKNDGDTFQTFAFGNHEEEKLKRTRTYCELNGCKYK